MACKLRSCVAIGCSVFPNKGSTPSHDLSIYFSIKFTTQIFQHSPNGAKFYSMQEKGLYSSLSLIQNAAQKV